MPPRNNDRGLLSLPWRRPSRPRAARCVSDRDDPAVVWHQPGCFANSNQKCLGLRIDRGVPFIESDLHGRLIKGGGLRASIVHENIELAELGFDLLKDSTHFFVMAHVPLHHKTVGTTLADFG